MLRRGCRCPAGKKSRRHYVVTRRNLATDYLTGVERRSSYCEVKCLACFGKWRTAAAYVAHLKDHKERKWNYKSLTDQQILDLIADGHLKVSRKGVVKKERRSSKGRWMNQWIVLSLDTNTHGYPAVRIQWNGHRKHIVLSRLVWLSVHGLIPEGYDVDHRDRNIKNSCISNLRLKTIHHNRSRREHAIPF